MEGSRWVADSGSGCRGGKGVGQGRGGLAGPPCHKGHKIVMAGLPNDDTAVARECVCAAGGTPRSGRPVHCEIARCGA